MQGWFIDKTLYIITEYIVGFRLIEINIQGLFDGNILQFLIDLFPSDRVYSYCPFVDQGINIFFSPVNIVFTFNTTESTITPHIWDNKVMRISIISTPTHKAKGKFTGNQVVQVG